MNAYRIVEKLGDGAYGCVYKAIKKDSQEQVAVKQLKKLYYTWEECLHLREIKALMKLKHPNIVLLKEVLRDCKRLYLIFEYMESNLYEVLKERNELFPEPVVKQIIFQIVCGLSYMHKHGFFHRDLKPENLLCYGTMAPEAMVVKLADFGLARELRSRPPYTEYISTRWYRAPELLLCSSTYSSPVDIWALGCIIPEIYCLKPLFPGSSELDQLHKITAVIGTPDFYDWAEGLSLSKQMNFKFPFYRRQPINRILPNASLPALQLVKDMLRWCPLKRPQAYNCLRYMYFEGLSPYYAESRAQSRVADSAVKTTEELVIGNEESEVFSKIAPNVTSNKSLEYTSADMKLMKTLEKNRGPVANVKTAGNSINHSSPMSMKGKISPDDITMQSVGLGSDSDDLSLSELVESKGLQKKNATNDKHPANATVSVISQDTPVQRAQMTEELDDLLDNLAKSKENRLKKGEDLSLNTSDEETDDILSMDMAPIIQPQAHRKTFCYKTAQQIRKEKENAKEFPVKSQPPVKSHWYPKRYRDVHNRFDVNQRRQIHVTKQMITGSTVGLPGDNMPSGRGYLYPAR